MPTIQNTYVYGLERIMTGEGEYFTYNSHGDTTSFGEDSYDYDAFGNQIDANAEASYNPFRYCGEYFDEETGFVYLRARYYDPSTQRFVTEDTHWNLDNMIYGDEPTEVFNSLLNDESNALNTVIYAPNDLSIKQSSNLYNYTNNNPQMYIDSSGNVFTELVVLAVVLGATVLISGCSNNSEKYIPSFPGWNPTVSPGTGWEWRGSGAPGSSYGA